MAKIKSKPPRRPVTKNKPLTADARKKKNEMAVKMNKQMQELAKQNKLGKGIR